MTRIAPRTSQGAPAAAPLAAPPVMVHEWQQTQSAELVIPCYNEATRMDTNAFIEFLSSPASKRVALLLVDDGSSDETPSLLRTVEAQSSTSNVRSLLEH